MGSGGFVGEAMDDDPKTKDVDESAVAFIVACGNTTVSGMADKDAKGAVRQSFDDDNGLACNEPDGAIYIHRLKDGGWYWINDEVSSAVAMLVPRDVHDDAGTAMVEPFDPGGVRLTTRMEKDKKVGKATYVKHADSGRVGILTHLQPVQPTAACGGTKRSMCVLSGQYTIALSATEGGDAVKGWKGGTITRGEDEWVVTAMIGGTGNLSITQDDASTTNVDEGATSAVFAVGGPGGTVLPTELTVGTLGSTGSEGASVTVTIPDATDGDGAILSTLGATDHCVATNQHRGSATSVMVSATGSTNTVPGFTTKGPNATFMVACPPVPEDSAQGQELVPENPFPVD